MRKNPISTIAKEYEKMKNRFIAIGLIFASACAAAQVPAERAAKYRQSAYYLMGQNLSQMNLMLKGDTPYNKASVELNAEAIELLGRIVFDAFPEGSDKGETKAKPEIWKETEKFKQLAHASQLEMEKLHAAAKTGDMAMLRTRFSETSKSCKMCHDQYKLK
jgi:cytochrome c556